MKIWDTAGQERFRQLTNQFYRQADGVVLAYDITDLQSFHGIDDWLVNLLKFKDSSFPKIAVGNKLDLE